MKTKTYSTKEQMSALAQLMSQDPDLARGYLSKPVARERWTKIAKSLNDLGPPQRTIDKWNKVWADFKSKTRIKLRHNQLNSLSDNKRSCKMERLNPLENMIAGIFENDETSPSVLEKKKESKVKLRIKPMPIEESICSRECSSPPTVKLEFTADPLDECEISKLDEVISVEKTVLSSKQMEIEENYYSKMLSLRKLEFELQKEKMDLLKQELIRRNQYRREKLILKKLYLQKQTKILEHLQNS